jgi:hypothetical protein
MPLSGELLTYSEDLPALSMPASQPLVLEGVEVLQCIWETRMAQILPLLPPAVHPTLPPVVSFVAIRSNDGPLGAFVLAQSRVHCRAGVRGRAIPLLTGIDNPDAGAALSARWGFDCRAARCHFRSYHDCCEITVATERGLAFSVAMESPEPVSGHEIVYTANLHPTRTPAGLRYVQVDPEYAIHCAARGRPRLVCFDARGCNMDGVELGIPVSACLTTVDLSLPRLRYALKPDVPAVDGTESMATWRA